MLTLFYIITIFILYNFSYKKYKNSGEIKLMINIENDSSWDSKSVIRHVEVCTEFILKNFHNW